MGLVALFAAILWGLDMLFNMPYAVRQRIIGVLYICGPGCAVCVAGTLPRT